MAGSSSTTRTHGALIVRSSPSMARSRGRKARWAGGETEEEGGAAARRAVDADGAAVRLDHGAADGEADAAGRGSFAAAEGLEDPFPLEFGDTDPLVADPHLDLVVYLAAFDGDRRCRRRVPRRVLQQIGDYLVEQRV